MGTNAMKLYEEVILLALRDDEGTTASGAWYQQAVAGAILSELLLDGHLSVKSAGRKSFVELASDAMSLWARSTCPALTSKAAA